MVSLEPHGIRVNALLPGPVGGARFDSVIASRAEALGKTFERRMEERINAVPRLRRGW